MLRKISHIVFALFLMIATAGVTFSVHYCGGELISASVNTEAKSCCDSNCGNCENNTLQFKIEDDYVIPVHIESDNIIELDILFPVLFVLNSELLASEEKKIDYYYDSSPPLIIQTRLALLQTYLC